MSESATKTLRAVFADYGPASLLHSGAVVPNGYRLDFIDTGTPVQGMARMVRGLEFDIVDMSPTTFLAAASRGVPIVAMPIAMFTEFPHALIWTHAASNVKTPAELLGKRIGVRTWLSPATIWLRGLIADEYGVDLGGATFEVTIADTLEVTLPANAQRSNSEPRAFKLLDMVQSGEVDAVVDALTLQWHHAVEQGKIDTKLVQPLFPDTHEKTRELYARFNFLPIMHFVVMKRETVERDPGVAAAMVDAFGRARNAYLEHLRAKTPTTQAKREAWLMARDRDNTELLELGIDPLPAGNDVLANLERLMNYMVRYGYLDAPFDLRAHFAGLS
jgi:4,5-dihydroxyphthalate decarboxylase